MDPAAAAAAAGGFAKPYDEERRLNITRSRHIDSVIQAKSCVEPVPLKGKILVHSTWPPDEWTH